MYNSANHINVKSSLKKMKKVVRKLKVDKNSYFFENDVEKEAFKVFFTSDFNEIDMNLFLGYATLLLADKQNKEALKYFLKAEEVSPINTAVLECIAGIYIEFEEYSKAFTYIQKLLNYQYDRNLSINAYHLLLEYAEKIGDDELIELSRYLVDYFQQDILEDSAETPYVKEMFEKAEQLNIQTEFNENLINHFKEIFDNADDLKSKRYWASALENLRAPGFEDIHKNIESEEYDLIFRPLGKLEDFPFKETKGQFVIYESEEDAKALNDELSKNFPDSSLVLGFITALPEQGNSLIRLTTGRLIGDKVILNNIDSKIKDNFKDFAVKYNKCKGNFIIQPDFDEEYVDVLYDECPFVENFKTGEIIYADKLDNFKDPDNDLIVTADIKGEKLQVLLNFYDFKDDLYYGGMLNQPENDIGIDKDDQVVLILDDGNLILHPYFENTEETKVILKIKSQLIGEPEKDLKYLTETYPEIKDNEAIVRAVLEMYDYSKPAFFKNLYEQEPYGVLDEVLEDVDELISKGKLDEAFEDVQDFVEYFELQRRDSENFYTMKEPFEIYFFLSRIDDGGVNNLPEPGDYSRLYSLYGHFLSQKGERSKVLDYYKMAQNLNPLNIENLNRLAIFYLDEDLKVAKKYIDDAFKYSWRQEHLKLSYETLKQYYQKIEDPEAVVIIDNILDGNPGDFDKDIPLGFSDEIKETADELFENAKNQYNVLGMHYMTQILNEINDV